jgi:hypothetical protein
MGILDQNRNTNTASRPSAVLGSIRSEVAAAAGQRQTASVGHAAERQPSLFWLNVGVTLEGAGQDGTDLFVSLPVGIPLDDMKPQAVRGNNADWIQLGQAKNALLEALQKAAAGLNPGDRVDLPQLSVQLYRKGEPAQSASSDTNPLVAALAKQLGG